ncbi:MAG TPA: hypothetical protein VH186_38610 [Chloroflexia bacterium]|nr:hypothetical protein [Chloroflexia bacterium]
MDFLTLDANNYGFYVAALLLSAVVIAVYKDWLLLTPALVIQFLALAVIANDLNNTASRVLLGPVPLAVFLQGVSGIVAGLILFLTGFAIVVEARGFRKEQAAEEEAGLGGLRRFFYREEAARLNRFRYVDYLLPLGAVIIAAGATYALTTLLPFSGNFLGDFAFYWLGSVGIAIMVVGRDILKLGAGLLVALNGVDLLYSLLRNGDSPLVLGISASVTILLALLISFLAILYHNKMKTLIISEGFQRKRKQVS